MLTLNALGESQIEQTPVICVVGPTASGKSDLAQNIAQAIDGEVVSADSMQIYKGMDIGTGKLLPSERLVPHFGLDLINPGEPYSAALFQDYARSCFEDIWSRGKRVVLCGGTGLYVRAAIDAYDFPKGEQVNNPTRDKYTRYAEQHGADALWELLRERDPESALVLHPNNVRRVVRAFEMLEDEGTNYATQLKNLAQLEQEIPAIFLGLQVEPDSLRERINRRVDEMVAQGLVKEVKDLLNSGFREGVTAPQAIGYKEIVAALDENCSMAEAIEEIKTSTRRYAKRQRTWFRKDTRIHWLDANDDMRHRLLDSALNYIKD
ncbi:MAG: tRNA (adenosine(37)-N6)-dimethylallyltransferase MiaA [Eggerthellaceae bacterium]|nr:tRNA (adenosine(37)-N6)-dimethylallyltransferase MiaA [Eggerthellaceae bacterium]